MLLTCNGLHLVPLAGLEPAACCLGDVPVQTLCRSGNDLVAYDREAIVISSSTPGQATRCRSAGAVWPTPTAHRAA